MAFCSFWNIKPLYFTYCHSYYCHSRSLIVIFCYLLSFVVTRCHSLCHSLSPVVPLVVTRCHSLYDFLSFVVTCCHSFYQLLSFVVTRCTTRLSFYKRSFQTILLIFPIIYRNICTELITFSESFVFWLINRKMKHDKCAYHRWTTPIKWGLLSLHDWHAKMKPFTRNCKGEYKLSIADLLYHHKFKSSIFMG